MECMDAGFVAHQLGNTNRRYSDQNQMDQAEKNAFVTGFVGGIDTSHGAVMVI
jgi:hypothetical protein